MLTYNELCKLLKQKTPFLFIDKVLEIEQDKRIVAIKNVSGNELFAALHFPDNPIYPGIFIIESIAQTAAVLFSQSKSMGEEGENQFLALGGIQRMQFMAPARPGDTLTIEVEVVKAIPRMAIVKAKVTIDNKVAAEGQLSFGVAGNE